MNDTARLSCLVAAIAAVSALSYGCSGGAKGSPGGVGELPENTGAIVATLTNIPNDVLCVEIDTSDYRTPSVRTDVVPGGSATIRLAPLSPGYVYLSGVAYNHPCNEWYPPPSADASVPVGSSSGSGSGGGSGSSGGGTGSDVTWEASSTYAQVIPGQITETELHFHQLGGLNVDVSFDNCDPNTTFGYCDGGAPDAGPDGWTTGEDSGPIIIVGGDAGFAQPGIRRH